MGNSIPQIVVMTPTELENLIQSSSQGTCRTIQSTKQTIPVPRIPLDRRGFGIPARSQEHPVQLLPPQRPCVSQTRKEKLFPKI
jgi:hypothetical protein